MTMRVVIAIALLTGTVAAQGRGPVELATRRGRLRLPVWLQGRGRPPRGSLFVPFFDETKLINLLTLNAVDPLSKEPDYKKCAAIVRKINNTAAPGSGS